MKTVAAQDHRLRYFAVKARVLARALGIPGTIVRAEAPPDHDDRLWFVGDAGESASIGREALADLMRDRLGADLPPDARVESVVRELYAADPDVALVVSSRSCPPGPGAVERLDAA